MKPEHKAAIRERAREALQNLQHNATPSYPDCRNDFEQDKFNAWFEDAARHEIEYIQGGGAWGNRPTGSRRLSLAEKLQWEKADRERAQYAPWEWISDFGELYQYGRGGRTLAPSDLVRSRGGSGYFILADEIADEWSIPRLIHLIRVVESFNKHVESWCKSVPEMWAEEKKETGLNRRIWHYDGKRRVSRVRYA